VVVANEFLLESLSCCPSEVPLFLRKLGKLPLESYYLKRGLSSRAESIRLIISIGVATPFPLASRGILLAETKMLSGR